MIVFNESLYRIGESQKYDSDKYKMDLIVELDKCVSNDEKAAQLRNELIYITRHITDGVRDLIKQDKRIRDLVLNQGAIPLASWAEQLDIMANFSIRKLKYKINDMKKELEHGRVQGFPGTMFLFNKPTFTTLEGFYSILFSLADELGLLD